MADENINDHGEEQKKPRFPMDNNEAVNRDALNSQEKNPAGSPGTTKPFGEETNALKKAGAGGKGKIPGKFNPADTFATPGQRVINVASWFFSSKKKSVLGIIGAVIVAVLIFVATLVKTFEMAHVSQLLQKLHMSLGENFSDGRSERQILYNIGGEAERGRLGITLTEFADQWEKKMIKDTGVRPLYNAETGRHSGYEIVDKTKFQDALQSNTKFRAAYQNALEQGAQLRSGNDVSREAVLRPTNRRGNIPPVDGANEVLDLQSVATRNFKLTRQLNRAIGNAVVGPRIVGATGARLQNIRGGTEYTLFENLKKKVDRRAAAKIQRQQAEDYEKNVVKRWANAVRRGSKKADIKNQETQAAIEEADAAAEQAQAEGKSPSQVKAIRGAVLKASGPVAVLGLACAVQDVGTNAADSKYASVLLISQRAAASYGLAGGDQERSGQKVNVDEVGAMNKKLHSEESSWNQNSDLLREMGQPTLSGSQFETPSEARLNDAGNKRTLFTAMDLIMNEPLQIAGVGLVNALASFTGTDKRVTIGTGCGALDAVAGAPVIEDIAQILQDGLNKGLSAIGAPTTDEAYGALINLVNGKALDLENLFGAPFMGVINSGMVVLSNDRFISMGGDALSDSEAAQQRSALLDSIREERAQKPLLARYFDPNDYGSLSGQLAAKMPSSGQQVASMVNPLHSFGALISTFTPKAKAVELPDYGVKRYGYTEREQDDQMFENPFENARFFEEGDAGQQRLDEMNDKYGKCFGMKVSHDEKGVHLESGKTVNVFKLEDERNAEFKDCRDVRKLPDNNPEKISYKRYRFYMADVQIALSLTCYSGKADAQATKDACIELGASRGQKTSTSQPVSGQGIGRIVEVAKAEYAKNGNKPLETCGENCGPEVQKYTGGPSGADAPWCAWFVSWVYREAGYKFTGAPAGADGDIPAVAGLVTWFKQHGIHFTPESNQYKPEPGDVIMYGGSVHTGIVVEVNGDNIVTIEGNTSGDGSFNANGETVGRKSFNYKTYGSRSIEFGRVKNP